MNEFKVILASSSPRRIEMLQNENIEPIIISPLVDETIDDDMSMEEAVQFLALKKALFVESSIERESILEPSVIIGADTVVYSDRIIGKPESKEEAFQILSELKGKTHLVATGVAILEPFSPRRKVFCEITRVFFKDYTVEEIMDYINTDEPYDKAGGYAIQGAWGKHIDHIEGDFENVIGFPLTRIKEELKTF